MMRFIVDCLRPARARAAAAQRDSVQLEDQLQDSSVITEVKELKDALQKEEEALQKVKTLRCDTQEAVEKLEERKSQLRDQLKVIQNLQNQEREVLQSLQEEQQELEQTIQQYDAKLSAVNDNVLQLQEEVACAKAHAENMHVRIAPLQDSFEEILQVKKKLDELIAGLMTDEHAVTERAACEKVDVLEDDFDHNYQDENRSQETEEVDYVKQEISVDEPDQMQHSAENLKSSGSSSFTEITLTEVKEEYVMFRSTSPQLDSSDMDEEDFEIVQPRQRTDRQFDFFHPNPFTDSDVFGDDHFPKADVTERLPSDPFKGTDPFASDTLFVDISEEKCCQNSFITAEQNLPETVQCPLQSAGKDRDYGTFNTPVNLPLDAHFKQSTGTLDRRASMPTECKSLKSRTNTCPEVGRQILDVLHPSQSVEAVSPQPGEDCVYRSVLSHSSSELDSFDGDCSTFAVEEEEDRLPLGSLCGLQKIIAGSYTEFPLSPCEPEPHPGISDTDHTFECEYSITSSEKDCSDSKLENENTKSSSPAFNNPAPLCEESRDINSDTSALDAYDYKYGDMFFFTVRLDPGSPELHNPSPGPESSEVKKCGYLDQLPWKDSSMSPEFNDTDEFKCCAPKPEGTKHHRLISYDKESIDKVEMDIETNSPLPQQSGILGSDSEMGNLHIPHLTFDDGNVCENMLNPESNDQWKAEHILDSSVQDTECSSPLKSTVQDLFSPLSNTETSATDQLCVQEKLSPESNHSQQHEPYCCERLAVSKSELQYFDPFSPVSTESNEFEEMYTVNCHDASRLDSGYHEVDTPTAGIQDSVDTSKYNFALQDPCLETSKESNCEFHIPDPVSPKSVDTGIFDSEIENYESDYTMSNCQSFIPRPVYTDSSNPDEKPMTFCNFVPCDVLIDHNSGSEHDDCYPFDLLPHENESYNVDSFEENVIPGLPQERSPASGETKPSCMASNGQSSQVIHCSSAWKASEISLPNDDIFDSVKHSLFEFDSYVPSLSKQAEDITNHAVNVTKMSDLADIDYFCSELSKMVSSRSSDSVQQSVTEMLFGSDPNASSFYPWDFENQQCNS